MHTGWIGHHPNSGWAASFEIVDARGLAKNIAVLGWRVLDFGRVFLFIPLMFLIYRYTQGIPRKTSLQLIFLLMLLVLIITPILVVHKGLVLHRYLLPIFVVMHILWHRPMWWSSAACSPLGMSRPWRLPPCLLYTSPSPRDRQKSRMPSSA